MTIVNTSPVLTEYSSDSVLDQLRAGDYIEVLTYAEYVLWDSSTDFIIKHGLPTDDDVRIWITVLASRKDAKTDEIEQCINMCRDYISS